MLDQETKRKIDNARDILVGKVPDPKSQVEQITIALIYKFMDDMDKESEEMGGKASFFTGEYEKYSWSKIFDPRIGGFDLLNLYGEAIVKMNQNPNIPQLFRDIFKNAFLPYRDPETLKAFLKEINEFNYDHSERLGDAFEYLLSVMDSQGGAGQFRTPRHIIDFIVSIVEPKKNETVLDPACGTAGFLISSYKHILQSNTKSKKGDKLTPAERKRLLDNFVGYDISPDMVRLSLVNMYLHGFQEPHIHEYDTLTSEDRWNDTFDVILANPPFMTPKGGIRPHNRFSIQAKRSEVLFVDYIAEHLNPGGRAGVIVPEGIIFQSSNAYKNLRKMLIKNYLWAVVSLPAGIFNPYSGVKTSILLMDQNLSKKTDSILFLKIKNDGFDLGAQRRTIDKNDLPKVMDNVTEYKNAILRGEDVEESELAHAVEISKIEESGDWNLSGERYIINPLLDDRLHELVQLKDLLLVKPEYGSGAKKIDYDNEVRYIRITDIDDYGNMKHGNSVSPSIIEEKYFLKRDDLLFARSGSVGRTYLHSLNEGKYQYAGYLIRFRIDDKKANPKYVYYITKSNRWWQWIRLNSKVGTLANINAKQYSSFEFPLPPLEIQKEIVAEIDGYQKIIDGARQVAENWKPTIKIDPDWEMVELGELCEIEGKITKSADKDGIYIGADSIEPNTGRLMKKQTVYEQGVTGPVYKFSGEKILYSKIRPYLNKLSHVNFAGFCSSDMYPLKINNTVVTVPYLVNYMLSASFNDSISEFYHRSRIPKINRKQLFSVKIPVPNLKIQSEINTLVNDERKIVDSNKVLFEIYEQKIKDKIAEVWGE